MCWALLYMTAGPSLGNVLQSPRGLLLGVVDLRVGYVMPCKPGGCAPSRLFGSSVFLFFLLHSYLVCS